MKKEIKDGKVAVLVSPGFGAGWYTWHGFEELIFDPSVVYMVEMMNKAESEESEESYDNWVSNIISYCEQKYPDAYLGGAESLCVIWLPEGTEFIIEEYDGSESIQIKEDSPWMKA